MLTWEKAVKEYKQNQAGSNTASAPTSGMLTWEQAINERKQYDSDGYKRLGQQRTQQRQSEMNRLIPKTSSSGITRIQTTPEDLQNQWLKKYQGKGYTSLASTLKELEDGEEKSWLEEYARKVDYDEKLGLDLTAYEKELQDLQMRYDQYIDPDSDIGDITWEEFDRNVEQMESDIDSRKSYLRQAQMIQDQAAKEKKFSDVTKNADFKEKSGYDSGNQELGYQYVNADASGRMDLEEKYGDYAGQFAERGWDSLDEDEKAIYNYFMNIGDRQNAAEYLKFVEQSAQERKGLAADAYIDKLVEEDPRANALRYAFMANVGYDQHLSGMRGAGNLIAGKDDYVPATATQVAGEKIREDLGQQGKKLPEWLGGGSTGQMVGDLISTTANMAPSMMAGLINPTAGAAMMGVSAGGGAYQEKINEGFTKEQARNYGIAIGASEAALSAALSGIKSLGGGLTNFVIDDALQGIKNGVGRFIAEWGTRIASEALEEGIQEILTPWFSRKLLNTDDKVDWSQVAYSALLGGLSAGILEVGDAYSGAKKAPVAENATAEKTSAVGDKTEATEGTIQMTEDLDSFAQQYGRQAEAVKRNYLEGQDLQEYELGFQTAYAIGKEGGSKENLQKVQYLSPAQKDIAYSMGRDAAAKEAKAPRQTGIAAKRVTDDGTQDVTIADVTGMDNDTMTFRLEDGSTVTDEELEFPDGAEVYSTVMELGMDLDSANAVIKASTESDQPRDVVAAGIETAYHHGKYGYGMEALLKSQEAAEIPESVLKESYLAGEKYRKQSREMAQNTETMGSGKIATEVRKGKVHFSGNAEELNNVQRESLTGLEWIADLTGAQIYVEDIEGNSHLSRINGRYDPADDSIHIDLRAGSDGAGTLLYTAGHEFTHRMKQNNESAFFRLADFLVAEYGKKGVSIDSLVKQQMADAAADGIELNYDEAFEEMVADAMEAMFTDTDALAKMEKLKTQDKSLWQEIKDFVLGLAEKIRAAYAKLKPDSAEARYVLQMKENIDQMAQLFAEGVMGESVDTSSASEASSVKYSRKKGSAQAEITAKFQTLVDQILNMQNTKQDHVVIGYTPEIYEKLGMPSLPFVIGTGHIYSAAKTEAEAKQDGNYRKKVHYHGLGAGIVKNIYEKLKDPVMIIASKDVSKNAAPMRSTHSIVAIVDVGNARKSLLLPVEITAERTVNGVQMDVNALSSIYEKAVANLVAEAIAQENSGEIGIFYAKKEALTLPAAGVQFPIRLQQSIASNGIVHRFPEKVNMDIQDATQSQQFKRWFGDWQNNPDTASKVVNPDGTPKVMYHGSPAQFTIFDKRKAKSSGLYGKGFYFTDSASHAGTYGSRYEVYLNIRNPLKPNGSIITRAQVKSYLEAVAENEDYSIENYGTYNVDEIIRNIMGRNQKIDAFQVIQDINATAVGDFVEAVELFNSINGTDFDGIIVPTETVAFNPEQIKSATDNIGTFDGSNPDIRYSRRKQTDMEALEEQNRKLQEDVERLNELVKLQGKVTHGAVFKYGSVEAAAKYLKKMFHTDGDTKELTQLLDGFYKYIASDKVLTWEGVKEQAAPIVSWLQENEKFQRDQYAQTILDTLKGQNFYLDETQLGEAKSQYGSIANYRRAVKNMASSKSSQSLDQLWQELSGQYPDIFSPDTSAADMPTAFAEAIDRLESMGSTESAMDWRMKDQAMMEAVYDSYWRVDALETVADRNRKKINEIRGKHYAKMTELRRDRDQKLKAAQARKEKAVQTIRDNRDKAVLRKKVEKVVNTLNNLLTNPTKTSHVLPKLQKPVAEILEALNMGTAEKQDAISRQIQRYKNLLAEEQAKSDPQLDIVEAYKAKIERLQDRGKSVSDNLARLRSAYADIKNSTDPEIAGAYMPELEEQLEILKEEVGDTPLQDMSLEQLDIVYTAYKMVLHNVTHANRLFGKLQKITAAEMTKEAAEQIRSNGIDTKDPPKGLKKASDKVNEMSWQNLRPVDAFRRLGSEKMMDLFWGLVDGMNERGKMTREIRDYLVKARKDSGYSKFDLKKADTYTTVDGKKMRLTLGEKMSIYAYSKREAAFDHMTKGGFTYAEEQAYKDEKGVTRDHNNAGGTWRLSLEDLENICNSLTAEQKRYADTMQKFLTEFGQRGNKVSRALFGIDLFKEQNYFPLMSNHDYLNSVQTDLGATQTASSLKNSGFTKSTTPGANNPIVLKNFDDVCLEHLDKMMNYIALTLPLENLRKVYDNVVSASAETEPQSTKALIGAVYGKSAQKYFDQFLKDANGTRAMTGARNPIASLFSKSKAAAVSANVSVMIQQISAVVRASAEISPVHLVVAKSYGKGTTRGKQSYEEMMTYSGIANIKDMGGYDVGSSTGLKDYLGMEEAPMSREKFGDIAQDVFGFGAEFMDKVGWTMIWNAVKREVASRKQYTVNSAEFFQACADRFEEVVVKTQVFDSVLSRSGYMRSDNDSVKYLTSFMGEPTVTAGMVFNSHLEVIRAVKNRKNVGYHVGKLVRTDATLIVTLVINGMLKALPYAARDDDEDESYWERWARHFGDSLRGDMNPLNLLPVARDISSIFEGRTIDRPDLALLSDLITIGKKAAKILMDEDAREELEAKDYWQLAEDVLGAIGNLVGVPVQNIWRDIESYIRVAKDIQDDIETVELQESLERGLRGEKKTKLEGIYDAMISGDTARLEALKATYKTEGSFESAVRKALRKHDPRIQEMGNARYEDDYERLEKLSYEIEDEGIFDMATIKAAYEAERKAQGKERGILLEEDSEEEKKAETTVFSMEAYYSAIRNGGSKESIDTAYDALLEEKLKEYYLEREAKDSIASSVISKAKGEYLDEDITKAEAVSVMTKYGGKTKDEAETEIKKWNFQKKYHYAWGSRDRCYRSGTISRAELERAVMDIEGATAQEAREYVDFLDLEMRHQDVDITSVEASGYFKHAKPSGISVEVYLDYKSRTKGIENDKDANGKAVAYSAVRKIMNEIGRLPLTDAQKLALAKSNGWADSTIQKYKTW